MPAGRWPPDQSARGIAVVGSDYLSSSLSVMDRSSGTVACGDFLDSGSAPAGLSVALTGDLIVPRHANASHQIVLIDRFPNAVVTFVDPDDFHVLGQLPVSTGFASNPHDFLWIDDGKAYVTRNEVNRHPGRAEFDEGDDLLVVDPLGMEVVGRIPLELGSGAASLEMPARPDRLEWGDERVWVSLNRLSLDFQEGGTGVVVSIDPDSDELLDIVELPGLTNCGGLAWDSDEKAMYVSCSGVFAAGWDAQAGASGLARIDLGTQGPTATLLLEAESGTGQPFGGDIAVVPGRFLVVPRYGSLARSLPDRLVAVHLGTLEEVTIHEARSAFGLGGFVVDEPAGRLYVADSDAERPGLYVYAMDDASFELQSVEVSNPDTLLPPRSVGLY